MAEFIWLNNEKYPKNQKAFYTMFCDKEGYNYTVAGFKKTHFFDKSVKEVTVNIFADAKYLLHINGECMGVGPAFPGGDYGMKQPMPIQYYNTYTLHNVGEKLEFYVNVQLLPEVQCEVSCGRGALWVEYTVKYTDGQQEIFGTDETWNSRIETEYISSKQLDFTAEPFEWTSSEVIKSVWDLKKSPISNLEEIKVLPEKIVTVSDNEFEAQFDKIYGGYICVELESECDFEVEIKSRETKFNDWESYSIKGNRNINVRMIHMESVGELYVTVNGDVTIKDIYLIYSHYPIKSEGSFSCSDEMLNKIYEVGKHTTDICRQSIELDSPRHQENLGCTGDYFIESLIAYYCFGDYSLSRFDIIRTAEYMRMTGAKMFHTSYSLIWVNMLYDYYMYSGDASIFDETSDVLEKLMELFDSYIGENGVIEHAPDYMFIDWVAVDEYSMHHPPKALGQAPLTAFYYNALLCAEKIAETVHDEDKKNLYNSRAVSLKQAFNQYFYDKENKLYFNGLNTPSNTNRWLPENSEKRYYTKHVNILAALYGLCEDISEAELMERVITDDELIDVQPYFMHFELEALYKSGLFGKYGLKEIHKWDKLIEECDKGMKEAWGEECQGYGYDHSHAWGSTPSYQLPSKIAGLTVLEPGFKKIALNPELFGLEFADILIPTPYGMIELYLGEENRVVIPKEIEIVK